MKKNNIVKPSAKGHTMVNVVRGASVNCLIVRYIVLLMESTYEFTTNQGTQKGNE